MPREECDGELGITLQLLGCTFCWHLMIFIPHWNPDWSHCKGSRWLLVPQVHRSRCISLVSCSECYMKMRTVKSDNEQLNVQANSNNVVLLVIWGNDWPLTSSLGMKGFSYSEFTQVQDRHDPPVGHCCSFYLSTVQENDWSCLTTLLQSVLLLKCSQWWRLQKAWNKNFSRILL